MVEEVSQEPKKPKKLGFWEKMAKTKREMKNRKIEMLLGRRDY